MNKNRIPPAVALVVCLALACNIGVAPPNTAPAQLPTAALPTNIPTQTIQPTNPVLPTVPMPVVENTSAPPPTVESAPAQPDNPLMADIQDYYQKGYLPYENGVLTSLPDFSRNQPDSEIHDLTRAKAEAQDFALWADIELNTIGEARYPNYTGCGFAYRMQGNGTGYTAILTNDYVRMGACSGSMRQCDLFGTIYGDGKVDVGNKTKVKFSLVVNKDHAAVLVDDLLIGKYALYTTKLLGMGDLYYDAVSNYGAGYWTTCEMTNIQLWESQP